MKEHIIAKESVQKAHRQIDAIVAANQERWEERAKAQIAALPKPKPPANYAEALARAQERLRGTGSHGPDDNIAQQLVADGLMPERP